MWDLTQGNGYMLLSWTSEDDTRKKKKTSDQTCVSGAVSHTVTQSVGNRDGDVLLQCVCGLFVAIQ